MNLSKKCFTLGMTFSIAISSFGLLSYADDISSEISTNQNEVVSKSELQIERVGGIDRYDTSVNVAKKYFSETRKKGRYLVVANGRNAVDSLSGGSLASEFDVPLLLIPKDDTSNESIKNFFEKYYSPYNTYIVGGENTISKNMEEYLSHRSIGSVIRLGGSDRFETAGKVIGQISNNRELAAIGDRSATYNSDKFSDALSSIPFMSAYNKNTYLPLYPYREGYPSIAIAFGGENSIPSTENVEKRIAGSDRYETAVEIAKSYKTMLNKDIDTVVITNADSYADALSASPLASRKNAAILLTKSDKLSNTTKEYIKSNSSIKNIIIVGGEGSISKNVENELKYIREGDKPTISDNKLYIKTNKDNEKVLIEESQYSKLLSENIKDIYDKIESKEYVALSPAQNVSLLTSFEITLNNRVIKLEDITSETLKDSVHMYVYESGIYKGHFKINLEDQLIKNLVKNFKSVINNK
ncbi:cell wall-binding repeat-containing protein [Peptostreptococcus faecalis]|uniref:cell wall-binding repeat-containing protein n=1 Tax=Peptostreptococcus faecalis TaxID=2045015 RepID=UPI000C7DEA17|nr:cell wall-binding repeat-containing protein [Peptostreptococcus faecalis]